jgi:hypothetical protein
MSFRKSIKAKKELYWLKIKYKNSNVIQIFVTHIWNYHIACILRVEK